MDSLKEMLNSKKFRAMLVGIITSFLVVLIPQLEPMEQYLTEIVGLFVAYIIGVGFQDFGKAAK